MKTKGVGSQTVTLKGEMRCSNRQEEAEVEAVPDHIAENLL